MHKYKGDLLSGSRTVSNVQQQVGGLSADSVGASQVDHSRVGSRRKGGSDFLSVGVGVGVQVERSDSGDVGRSHRSSRDGGLSGGSSDPSRGDQLTGGKDVNASSVVGEG